MTAHICSKEKEWSPLTEIGMGLASTVLWVFIGSLGGAFALANSENILVVSGYFGALIVMIAPGLVNGVGTALHGAYRLVRQ